MHVGIPGVELSCFLERGTGLCDPFRLDQYPGAEFEYLWSGDAFTADQALQPL